jgi:hypothetical protein
VCRTRASSPAVAPPDALAALRNVITSLRLLEEPIPLPVALRGEICRPSVVLFPTPDTLAFRIAVCRPIAWSPAVAEPEPVAPRGETCIETMKCPDVADAEAVLRTVCSCDTDEEPLAVAEAVSDTVLNPT